jgi:hypothetical protein
MSNDDSKRTMTLEQIERALPRLAMHGSTMDRHTLSIIVDPDSTEHRYVLSTMSSDVPKASGATLPEAVGNLVAAFRKRAESRLNNAEDDARRARDMLNVLWEYVGG